MKYIIIYLDKKYVTFRVTINGEKITKTFCNSKYDRNDLLTRIPTNLYNKVLNVWGDTPTVDDLSNPNVQN